METGTTIHLAAWLVSLIGGSLVPVATGLATKLSAAPGKKALIGVALSAAVTVLAYIVDQQGTFVPQAALLLFAMTFSSHVVSYYGAWKPLGGGAAPGAKATAEVGIS